MSRARTTIVIPTVGRPSLRRLLEALAGGSRPVDAPVVLVDDRPDVGAASLDLGGLSEGDRGLDLRVLRSGGGGPARARNLGWRHAATEWVSFLDDDVLPDPDWYAGLLADLTDAPREAAGVQGRVRVPLPEDRRPTDWERGTAGLAAATWITADLSYRRAALSAVGGFDERFPRAFREDADLGLRISSTQGPITTGRRWITHPVRPAGAWASVRQQAGNADDFLMRALHGPRWRERVRAPRGRRTRHLATTGSAAVGAVGLLAGRRRTAALGALGWLLGTGELAARRIVPGPRTRDEVGRMLATSVVIPFAATRHSVAGALRHRQAPPWRGLPDAVLFDRDGTLVEDVPYNGDPDLVRPVAGAAEAVDRLRRLGVRLGVVSNQSGVARGRIGAQDVRAVNARVERLLGPFDVWRFCPHEPADGCTCRKPAPGMVKEACAELGVDPARTVVVGDIGSDVEAAEAAGAVGFLVPTPKTRRQEVLAAERVRPSLSAVVDDLLGGLW